MPMNNIFNARVVRLIKADLLEWIKHLACLAGIGFLATVVIPFIVGFILDIRVGIFDISTDVLSVVNMISLIVWFAVGIFGLIMFITGITSGYELPQYVRKGISRKEYFISTVIASTVAAFLVAPVMLTLNFLVNFILGSESIFYNAFLIGDGNIVTLALQFLGYMTAFFLGYCIAIYWQRVGWFIAVITIISIIVTTSILGLNLNIFSESGFIGFSYEGRFIVEGISLNATNSTAFFSILPLLGIATYAMIRNVTVNTK